MKAALVYTSTTPELIELVNREVRKNIGEIGRASCRERVLAGV